MTGEVLKFHGSVKAYNDSNGLLHLTPYTILPNVRQDGIGVALLQMCHNSRFTKLLLASLAVILKKSSNILSMENVDASHLLAKLPGISYTSDQRLQKGKPKRITEPHSTPVQRGSTYQSFADCHLNFYPGRLAGWSSLPLGFAACSSP